MKIIICGSITAADEILAVQKTLEGRGYEVEIPEGVKDPGLRSRTEVSNEEKATDKIKRDLIRTYFAKIKSGDAVLVVNPDKKGVHGYIGGNTLIEMAFAHVLRKKLYVLHPLPKMTYSAEIAAMQPEVINEDLSRIPTYV